MSDRWSDLSMHEASKVCNACWKLGLGQASSGFGFLRQLNPQLHADFTHRVCSSQCAAHNTHLHSQYLQLAIFCSQSTSASSNTLARNGFRYADVAVPPDHKLPRRAASHPRPPRPRRRAR